MKRNILYRKHKTSSFLSDSDISTSGPVSPQTCHVSESFTDYTELPSKGYCRLVKAQRYGVWNVLKGLKPEYVNDKQYQEMVSKEFSLMVGLNHPNIVRTYGLEQIQGMGTFIVMEFVDGRTLSDFIAENPTRIQRRQVLRELLDALSYFHKKQIVHQDLKPSNILITNDGNHVKVIDFGLSDSRSYAILKEPAYTQAYASPEQLAGGEIDNRTDIYAFGLILQQLFPHRYTRIVRKCIQAQCNRRYGSADDVLDALRRMDKEHKWIPVVISAALLFVAFLILLFNINNQKLEQKDGHFNESVEGQIQQKIAENEVLPANENVASTDGKNADIPNDNLSEKEAQELLDQYIYNLKFEFDSILKPFEQDLKDGRILYREIFHNRLQITLLKFHIHIQKTRQRLPQEKQISFVQYARMLWGQYAAKYPYTDDEGNNLYPYYDDLHNLGKISDDEYARLRKEDEKCVAEIYKLSAQLKKETAKD